MGGRMLIADEGDGWWWRIMADGMPEGDIPITLHHPPPPLHSQSSSSGATSPGAGGEILSWMYMVFLFRLSKYFLVPYYVYTHRKVFVAWMLCFASTPAPFLDKKRQRFNVFGWSNIWTQVLKATFGVYFPMVCELPFFYPLPKLGNSSTAPMPLPTLWEAGGELFLSSNLRVRLILK